jgi:hypothetical protein
MSMSTDVGYQILKPHDLAALFGSSEKEILEFCGKKMAQMGLSYQRFEQAERDMLLLQVLERIESEKLAIAGERRKGDWEDGWQQNLDEFIESKYDLKMLIPKYFKKNVPFRLFKDYALGKDKNFVYNMTDLFRTWIFRKYLADSDFVYEFGCGTGHNLVCLAQMFPSKRLFGFDWARSSQEILKLIADHFEWDLRGYNFDFFHPSVAIDIAPQSAFFTLGALEQVGPRHQPFLDFVLEKKPKICVNVECLHELYDQDCLTDYVALKYHKKRNYLDGYVTKLKELETQKKVEIIKIHRQTFGNLYDDPHSYIVWRPT